MHQYQMGCHPFRNVLSAVADDHTEMNSISSITSRRNTDKAAALWVQYLLDVQMKL